MELNLISLFLAATLSVSVTFVMLCIIIIIITKPYPNVHRSKKEHYFVDPTTDKEIEFPSLTEPWSIHLSVVVPAFDEAVRLPPMLDECLQYLQNRTPDLKYEVIVVSDGSRDSTAQVAREYTKKYGPDVVRVLELETNRGKGGAVRLGVQSARGAVILFADADGATKFSDLKKLEDSLSIVVKGDYVKSPDLVAAKPAIVCGSRAHLEEEAISSRSYIRTILMYGFHFLVWLFAVRDVKDTQCGFKLLTREAARTCFSSMHVERWAFDVELLYIAQRLKIPISEVAVNWTEIEGSKVVPVWSWLQMGRDLFLLWLRYRIGAWKLAKRAEPPAYDPEPDYPNGLIQGPLTEYLQPSEDWASYPKPPSYYEPLDKFLRRVKKNAPFKEGAVDVPDMECICMKKQAPETIELENLMKRRRDELKRTVYKSEICHYGDDKFGNILEEKTAKITLPEDWIGPRTTYGSSYRKPEFIETVKPFKTTKDHLKVDEIQIKVRKLTTGESEYTEKICELGKIIIEDKMHGEVKSFAKGINCFEILQRKIKTALM